MGALISIPDEVLITHVTKGLIGTWTEKKEELYAVRATCKSGLVLARRTIADKKVMRSLSCSFFAPPQRPWQPSTEPQEMRVSAQVVEAMGRVWGHGCTFLIKYAAEDSLRAVDMLRLVTGCPKLEDLNWIIREDLHDHAELDEAPLQAIEELLESRGGNTACYAIGEWNEDELDPDCIFE